jgi:hypothetical protein
MAEENGDVDEGRHSEDENVEKRRTNIVALNISSGELQIRKRLLEKNLKQMWIDGFEGPFGFPDLKFRCRNKEIVLAQKLALALVGFLISFQLKFNYYYSFEVKLRNGYSRANLATLG